MRTVYFATNRALTGPADQLASYGSTTAVSPTDPTAVTYGTAFVEDAGLDADTVGAIKSINTIRQGQFSDSAKDDLSDPGRNLLVFVHGFDNTFENAITRAAFNQQWLEQSGVPAASSPDASRVTTSSRRAAPRPPIVRPSADSRSFAPT